MSEATYDSLEAEAYEGEAYEGEAFEGEAYEGEGEAYEAYEEASRSRADRERQRRIMVARQRQLRQRRGPVVRPVPRPRRTSAGAPAPRPAPATLNAVRAVDLDAKVAQDSLQRQLQQANQRASRSMYSALATGAVGQALDTYQDNLKDHPFVRAAIRWAPLAVLPPDKSRKGIEAVALHPAFISGALIGGIFLIGKLTNPDKTVRSIELTVPTLLDVDEKGTLLAKALDRDGRTLTDVTIAWKSSNPSILAFDGDTASFTALAAGLVTVTASSGDVQESASIRVESAAAIRSIAVFAPTALTVGDGGTVVATAADRDGRLVPGVNVSWSSSDNKIVTVTPNGTLQAVGRGVAVVSAVAAGVQGSVAIRVAPATTQTPNGPGEQPSASSEPYSPPSAPTLTATATGEQNDS
ncbi:hypothetical protein JIG36_35475 [Actinoplanes sp. LDG1-06]|uniref:BIG2 domain-containing protein n=1 Tax=Paractinoplanes ovalisporus TaxID=2810368 RepID=A0ABS2ALU5_9ACTN|nr:hypothetical protein [Actinoplanes ovalisporus]MBM2620814.1 hypothetical protein [Actinoplanes ovalisporus]